MNRLERILRHLHKFGKTYHLSREDDYFTRTLLRSVKITRSLEHSKCEEHSDGRVKLIIVCKNNLLITAAS